jgi:hypothetical protein
VKQGAQGIFTHQAQSQSISESQSGSSSRIVRGPAGLPPLIGCLDRTGLAFFIAIIIVSI